jgi:hypothetical protein
VQLSQWVLRVVETGRAVAVGGVLRDGAPEFHSGDFSVQHCGVLKRVAPAAVQQRMRVSGGGGGDNYAVAVAAKIQASVKQEGKDIVKLIDSSTMGASGLPAGVGQNLNIKA